MNCGIVIESKGVSFTGGWMIHPSSSPRFHQHVALFVSAPDRFLIAWGNGGPAPRVAGWEIRKARLPDDTIIDYVRVFDVVTGK
jgi:hypothetical protein